MAIFFADDNSYNLNHRMTGFNRYRQLFSFYGFRWLRVNMIVTVGLLPLIGGIAYAILTSSLLLLIPFSLIGGMIAGPFLSCLYDSLMRGFRDAPGKMMEHFTKAWKQNFKGSLLPGAVTGLLAGLYSFMLYMLWNLPSFPGWGTVALYVFSFLLFLTFMNLYWIQLVLFEQTIRQRLINIILFTSKYLWKVLFSSFLEMLYILLYILFFPWTTVAVPFLGLWYILFVVIYRLYDPLNASFKIEEQLIPIEGDPWAADPIETAAAKLPDIFDE